MMSMRFECFAVCWLCFVLVYSFRPDTYISLNPIKSLDISSSDDVFIVSGSSVMVFHNGNISESGLIHQVAVGTGDKITFFKLLKTTTQELMIACSSKQCYLNNLEDIETSSQVVANSTHFSMMATLGADISAEAVFDNCPDAFCRIFSAQTTDNGDTYIAERYLYIGGTIPSFASTHSEASFIQSKRGLDFDFVYSFESGDHVYFLRNVRDETGSRHAFISQMCLGDMNFRSFIESKLECGGYKHLLTATIIHTHDDVIMFASFSLRPFVDDVTPDASKSVICTYRVSELAAYFDRSLTNCFKHMTGTWPQWIKGNGEACSHLPKVSQYRCGHTNQNTRIEANTTLQMTSIKPTYQYKNVVSIVTRQQGSLTLCYLGTQEGHIIKILLNVSSNQIIRLLKLPVSTAPVRHLTLNNDGTTLFYIAGIAVGKVPLDQCEIHSDCYSCLISGLPCVWSTDRITGLNGTCISEFSVSKYPDNQNEKFCRPIVQSIEPMTGPVGGGTIVTITGQLDIPAWYGDLYAISHVSEIPVNVLLGETPCQVVSVAQFPKMLVCVTSGQPQPINKTVHVEMRNVNIDTGVPHRLVRSQSTALNIPVFSFMEPSLSDSTGVERQRARLSGGTQVTIRGLNLNIGNRNSKHITIGNKTCDVTAYDSVLQDKVTCKSPAQPVSGEYDVTYSIDNNTVSGRLSVMYITDPNITNITPRASTVSGGMRLTITGDNLIGLGRNDLTLKINIFQQKQTYMVNSSCTYLDDSESFVCVTSPSPLKDGELAEGHVTLYNTYGEMMALNTTLYIVPDPSLIAEDKLLEFSDNILVELTYSGERLENVSIDDVTISVSNVKCRVTSITTTWLMCIIEDTYALEIGLREKVTGKIGNREYDLGTVAFQDTVNVGLSREAPAKTDKTDLITILKFLGGAILGVMVMGTVVFGAKKKCQQIRKNKNDRYSVHYHGDNHVLNLQGLSADGQQNRLNDYVETRMQRADTEGTDIKETLPLLLDEETRNMFEQKHLLIPCERLIVGETVGQGNFGCVYKGYLQMPEEKSERIVACKTLQRNKPKDMDVSSFLKEASIMKDFHHKNVMELVGICLGIEKLPLVILPFMRMGDVLTYIRNVQNVPTVKDLVVFGVDIANGMHYLSQLKFVHRDLAARNCMIDEDMTVKVADFGLSRDVYEKEYYSSCDKKAQLPVKWMSPESLELGLFTTKSDVWSFGVTLWELLTRGVNPYATVDNWDILRYLKEGRRLHKPDFCPEEMYRIMQSCWQWNTEDRPTFGELTVSIPELLRRLERASERRRHLASLSEGGDT